MPDLTPYPTALAYTDDAVYFERGGEVFRAPFTNPIAPDGFPAGRWECSLSHWQRFAPTVHAKYATRVFRCEKCQRFFPLSGAINRTTPWCHACWPQPCDNYKEDQYVCYSDGTPKGQCANCGYPEDHHPVSEIKD